MKHFFIILSSLLSLTLSAQSTETALTINNKVIQKNEFLKTYLKNNSNPIYTKEAIDEYLTLYTKYKLKVTEAESLGYDTIPKLKNELNGYRKTLAIPYLIDKTTNEKLILESYNRLKKEIRASHILIKVDESASPQDTLKAYNKLLELKKRIDKGEDFAEVAKTSSDDPSAAKNNGDLGYFTAFQMVFPFEEAAFNTPVGKTSSPVRTKFGYHILKVVNNREARGQLKTAHIMISVKRNASTEEVEAARKKINEIHLKLNDGDSFEELAKNFSDDINTSNNGGQLPVFGTGTNTRMIPEFEEVAYSITENGAYSSPMQTDFGFHIVKRISHSPIDSFDKLKKEIQQKIQKDERGTRSQSALIENLKKEYQFKQISTIKELNWYSKNIDSTFISTIWTKSKTPKLAPLFSFAQNTFTTDDFLLYLQNNKDGLTAKSSPELILKKYNDWINQEIIFHENKQLEAKYPEFKAIMQEYHDGVLLYEIMTDKIWNKANQDTLGLNNYFNENRSKYQWKERANVTVYECLTNEVAENVSKLLKKKYGFSYNLFHKNKITSKEIIQEINKNSELNLSVKMNKYEISETPFLKNQKITLKQNISYSFNGKIYILDVAELLPICNKELKEVKGLVTSDYQNHLEKLWINELIKKYKIEINYPVVYSLGKN
jgi:peptidyl-prolyl cis-trans isomerase SurA